MRAIWRLPPRPPDDADLPHETRYADGGNFYSTSLKWLQSSLPTIADTLHSWPLKVSTQKCEWVTVSSESSSWRAMRQLGSLMCIQEDIASRQQVTIAFHNMFSLWKRRKNLSEGRQIRLYEAYILPSLMYDCCTWGVNETMWNKLHASISQPTPTAPWPWPTYRPTNIDLDIFPPSLSIATSTFASDDLVDIQSICTGCWNLPRRQLLSPMCLHNSSPGTDSDSWLLVCQCACVLLIPEHITCCSYQFVLF